MIALRQIMAKILIDRMTQGTSTEEDQVVLGTQPIEQPLETNLI